MNMIDFAEKAYSKIIDLMHFPLHRRGADDPYHAAFHAFVDMTRGVEAPSVLEIGSRVVTGVSRREIFAHCAEYVGFDILPGEGVDVVGDAHRLAEQCPVDHFDFVFCASVFEHLLFPWKVALEINKVLKTGGHVFVSTHPVWPSHEEPWDFWRFPGGAFQALFNVRTGFEIVSVVEGLPCKIYSLVDDAPTRGHCFRTLPQGVAATARKTGEFQSDLINWNVDARDVLETMYPKLEEK